MAETGGRKKRKLLAPETEEKVQELESFLFGSDDAFRGFGKEQEEHLDRLQAATKAKQAKPAELAEGEDQLLVWEDRGDQELPGRSGTILQALEEQNADADADAELRPRDVEEVELQQPDTDRPQGSRRKAVWEDPDDANVSVEVAGRNRLRKLRQTEEEHTLTGTEYERRLRQLHSRMNPRATWAKLDRAARQRRRAEDASDAEGEEAGERLLAGAEPLLGRDSSRLGAKVLEVSRVRDANEAEPSNGVVRSVEFHPSGQLLLTASLDKRLRFFQVDGRHNEKVQSLYLEDLPIHQAGFACDGRQVVAVGRRKFFYLIDLAQSKIERIRSIMGCTAKSLEKFVVSPAGTPKPLLACLNCQGSIPLVSLQTRQAIGHLQTSSNVRSAAFTPDGLHLMTSGKEGLVHVWDLRMQRCIHQQQDQGSIIGTSLAVSPASHTFAAGSDSGVVNLYDTPLGKATRKHAAPLAARNGSMPQHVHQPDPLKSYMNLTTEVNVLGFSPDGQMLAMASPLAKNAMRIAHVPSQSVFENWPTANTPLGHVHSLSFSPGGGLLAVGNAKGRVLLYRMLHYAQL